MEDKRKHLGEFLKLRAQAMGFKRPKKITVPQQSTVGGGGNQDFKAEDLENGDVKLASLLNRATPLSDLFDAIAGPGAYDVDRHLLDPYDSMAVAGPVVLSPPESSSSEPPNFHDSRPVDGCRYCSPRMHLAGSRLYPVLFTLDGGNSHTPPHSHPGTEALIVIQGQARAEISAQTPVDPLEEGDVLHFRSDDVHTICNMSEKPFSAWAFRELPPPAGPPWAILGRQLQSWRLHNRKGLNVIADLSYLTIGDLEAFERKGRLPFPPRAEQAPTREDLCTLRLAYEVGLELLIPFTKSTHETPVHASVSELAGRPVDDRTSLEDECRKVREQRGTPASQPPQRVRGARYYWPDQIRPDSLIRPGLVCIVPFSRTPPHRHPGSEIVLVIEGKAEIHFPDNHTKIDKLEPGCVAHFDSDWKHTIVNVGEQALKTWVLRDYVLSGWDEAGRWDHVD